MNNTKEYAPGAVVFREGDPGDCMYEIEFGSVGIYHDYGGAHEEKIAELYTGKVFGEMGLLEHAPRSATAVVMEKNTVLTAVSEENFFAYFEKNPPKVLDILQQMCSRLRRTTQDYIEACHTVYDAVEAEKEGKKSPSLLERILKLCGSFDPYYPYY